MKSINSLIEVIKVFISKDDNSKLVESYRRLKDIIIR